ncbi:hypothetical protein SUGI_0197710 [Cryptomeria japonica]|nr:hypothetical protein SUGI_0197710 [Cryptomeria japonica]
MRTRLPVLKIISNDLEPDSKSGLCLPIDYFTLGEGIMLASFKIPHDPVRNTMIVDFGKSAIGRVAPIHSGFWWINSSAGRPKVYRRSFTRKYA